LYRDTRKTQIICIRTPAWLTPVGQGKNRAVPVLHRDPPAGGAKVEAPWPVLRQVTPTNFIAVPLAFSSTTPDD